MAAIIKYKTSEEVYNITDGEVDEVFYVGSTADIKAVYKSIVRNRSRHWSDGECTNIAPLFMDSPVFSKKRAIYGLCIDRDNWITVVNSDTLLMSILSGDIVVA